LLSYRQTGLAFGFGSGAAHAGFKQPATASTPIKRRIISAPSLGMKNLHVTMGLTKPQGDTNICELPHIRSPKSD
jgi:hypothetical protein